MIFRPFTDWPKKPTISRRNWPGDASYPSTIEMLEKELDAIYARNCVLQLELGGRDIRRDGYPRADSRPFHPGVIVTFDLARKDAPGLMPMVYAIDTFFEWQYNMRAIAFTLNALRGVDRWGGATANEQYMGYAALPPATPMGASSLAVHHSANPAASRYRVPDGPFETVEFAARYIVNWAGEGLPEHVIHAKGERERLIKLAKAKAHPDSPTGSNDGFLRLSEAIQLVSQQT